MEFKAQMSLVYEQHRISIFKTLTNQYWSVCSEACQFTNGRSLGNPTSATGLITHINHYHFPASPMRSNGCSSD